MKTELHEAAEVNPTRHRVAGDFASALWPVFGAEEVAAVAGVLRSGKVNYWTGEEGRQFEREFAASEGRRFGVAVSNGTLALELALRALGVGPGDEVITTARTFIASASCAAMIGAHPVLVDVDRDSQNLTAITIAPAISARTRAIVAVHLNGWPCDMEPIMQLARAQDLAVLEDCAQAQGASSNGRLVGSVGDTGAFSFCQDKIMTTGGEGGMIVMDDAALHEKVWSLKDHGKAREGEPGRPYGSFGTNARMTEMQAAIGRIQVYKVRGWLAERRRNAAVLQGRFAAVPGLRVTVPAAEVEPAWYRYTVFVEPGALKAGWSRDRIAHGIAAAGVPCFTWANSQLQYQKAFADLRAPSSRPPAPTPVAQELSETSLIFLVHPTLSEEHMQQTADTVASVMAEARR